MDIPELSVIKNLALFNDSRFSELSSKIKFELSNFSLYNFIKAFALFNVSGCGLNLTLKPLFNKHEIRNISHIIEMASEKFDKYEIDNFLEKNFYNYGKTIEYFEKNFSKICN